MKIVLIVLSSIASSVFSISRGQCRARSVMGTSLSSRAMLSILKGLYSPFLRRKRTGPSRLLSQLANQSEGHCSPNVVLPPPGGPLNKMDIGDGFDGLYSFIYKLI